MKKVIAPGALKVPSSVEHEVIGPEVEDGRMFQELERLVQGAIQKKEQMLIFV